MSNMNKPSNNSINYCIICQHDFRHELMKPKFIFFPILKFGAKLNICLHVGKVNSPAHFEFINLPFFLR